MWQKGVESGLYMMDVHQGRWQTGYLCFYTLYPLHFRSEDPHIKEGYYFHVVMSNSHNHRVSCTDALAKRDFSKETTEKLTKLFESGHKLYKELFKDACGAADAEEMPSDLQKRLDNYNQEQRDVCAKTTRTDEGQQVIAICTPLMKTVPAKVRQSGEMLFMDSTGNCHRPNHRLFLLLTHSSAGGLPLGVLITASESQPTVTAALKLLGTILPEDGSYSHQEKGPEGVTTDNGLALRNSLKDIYQDATCTLYAFRLAQAMWRWLWSSHQGIPKGHRSQLMKSFQLLMYADTPSSLAENYRVLTEDPVAKGHPQFMQHLTEVYGSREEWAICLQSFPANKLQPQGTSGLEDELARVFESLTHKLRGDPDFIAPLASFIASYDRMTTDSALRSAFIKFGKTPMAKATGYQKPKGSLQTTAQMPVQPTAVGRRKARLGGRRQSGRPSKASREAHPYKRTGRKPAWLTVWKPICP